MPGHCPSRRPAFALIELLASLALVALIAMLILGAAGYLRDTSLRRRAEADLARIAFALSQWQAENGAFPGNLDEVAPRLPVLMPRATNAPPAVLDPWGQPYRYTLQAAFRYDLFSCGPDGAGGTADDVRGPP